MMVDEYPLCVFHSQLLLQRAYDWMKCRMTAQVQGVHVEDLHSTSYRPVVEAVYVVYDTIQDYFSCTGCLRTCKYVYLRNSTSTLSTTNYFLLTVV